MAEISLGEREADVMKALWALRSGTVADVRARLPVSLAYTTVLTILRRLQEKGFVEPEVEGRAHRCRPLISESEVRSNALSRLVSGSRSVTGRPRLTIWAQAMAAPTTTTSMTSNALP